MRVNFPPGHKVRYADEHEHLTTLNSLTCLQIMKRTIRKCVLSGIVMATSSGAEAAQVLLV